jgi:PhoH-like ATPase
MDNSVQVLTLLGPAGTGKTFLTLLIGLYKVMTEHAYRKFLISRPIVALGADIGFLPGDVQEKLFHWMQPVYDNLEFIFSQMKGPEEHERLLGQHTQRKGKDHKKKHADKGRHHGNGNGNGKGGAGEHHGEKKAITDVDILQQRGILSLEAITYMRGRSIPHQFVFIDEVQNLTPHEVKTIVSRAGEGTKVILAGDPHQIDSPYLDFSSNGLTVTTDKLKDEPLFGTVYLETSERSELAKLAAEAL